MSIYIGNQTAFFTSDPEEPFKYALQAGFTAFEWFSDKKHYDRGWSSGWEYADITPERAGELRRIVQKTGMRFSVHASCKATPFTPEGIKDIFKAIELADSIHAKLVNIHLDKTSGIAEFAALLEPVIIAARLRNVQLAVENTPLHAPEDFNQLFEELAKLELESIAHVGMCLDIGHANCCEATRNDYIGFIDRLAPEVKIIHLHVHENWGDSDSHLPLFTAASAENDSGVRLFVDRMLQREYAGSVIMEQWPDEHELLDTIFVRLGKMFGLAQLETENAQEPTEEGGAELDQEGGVFGADTKNFEAEPSMADSGEPAAITAFASGSEMVRSESWVLEEIISFSRTSRSWRTRLQAVRALFFDSRGLQNADLAAIAVYLRFLATGEIVCEEDGGHYRPCHHAQAALEIEQALAGLRSEENAWVIRRIYPYLPSHEAEFRRHEPLTRIRDIAHRNDLPKELKQDIKHNLQNKLHRSAGPEDLQTAERILQTITAPGANYSSDFVGEFKVFYAELQEFFNAVGLEQRLGQIREAFPEFSEVIATFIRDNNSLGSLLKAQSALAVRQAFKAFSVKDKDMVFSRLRLADIELEDYAFAMLSETINDFPVLESVSGRGLEIILVALEHIQLSEFMVEEAECILAEIRAWRLELDEESDRLVLLRLWASVLRGLRLCSEFADIVNSEFSGAAVALGEAFAIPTHAVAVYCEGYIRANVIFQLSRILGRVQRCLRTQLDFAPWSVINGGVAGGQIIKAETLEEFENKPGNYIVLLSHAEGDEEIPASVRAILLAHPLAHLSHLGVRARSGGVPFATAEESRYLAEFENMCGRVITLEFDESGVREIIEINADTSDVGIGRVEPVLPEVSLAADAVILPVELITPESCGAKAASSAELYAFAEKYPGFSAPRVMALPYGVMEFCLNSESNLAAEYAAAVSQLAGVGLEEIAAKLEVITAVIKKIPVPDTVLNGITGYFGAGTVLAVRSSSSGEDLAGFAGAGLYDSVIGVTRDKLAGAIRQVWASKWTKRAVLSRKKFRIPDSAVYMGVLIQESVAAEYSFVMHTANPVSGKKGEIAIELAVGLGETLASANQPGFPCSILAVPADNSIEVLRCADISKALVYSDVLQKTTEVRVNYSKVTEFLGEGLVHIGSELSRIGSVLEEHFGGPQDIEGAYAGGKYYIVQSRPQAGVEKE